MLVHVSTPQPRYSIGSSPQGSHILHIAPLFPTPDPIPNAWQPLTNLFISLILPFEEYYINEIYSM